ncbi:MAG: cation:proton antiporter [Tannerella sp.]|nr:cation:proton antiporter [Tannerella sp.]
MALILISAGIITVIFKWLRQPVVLGYIVAGFVAGPHLNKLLDIAWPPTVSDIANISTWADIGVIFLLFALGLEFSFKKLLKVGGQASIATLINMGSMIGTGYLVGKLLGWGDMDSIFLGGMLSMSSTTIIIKAFNDMNLQKTKFANIVFGMLIVEDLAAILMMVLLTTFAVSKRFEGGELVTGVVKLMFFIFMWFVVGIYLIPTILKWLKKYLNDETLLIISVGLCFGMVMFASSVGFSSALGAFIMGSILAETIESKHIEHIIEPLKNFFGAVFFVSVGMMMEPLLIWEYAGIIILLTLVVLIGRVIFTILGVIASGQRLKVAIQSGFSLAQIGEFSFIIATLGMSLGVISKILYPIIVAVSVITTFTTPYFIRMSPAVSAVIERLIPPGWSKLITGYSASDLRVVNKQNDWNRLLKSVMLQVGIYLTISVAVILICKAYLIPFVTHNVAGVWGKLLGAVITLLFMSPFIRAMIMKKLTSEVFKKLWNDNHFNRAGLILMILFRGILGVILISMVLIPLFSIDKAVLIIISLILTVCMVFSRGLKLQSKKIESRFLENLSRKQRFDDRNAAILSSVADNMLAKNIHVEEFDISPSSHVIGKTLKELQFKQKTGVSVITILRGNRKINIPGPNEHIYPCDRIVVSGSDEELKLLVGFIGNVTAPDLHEEVPQYHINLSQFEIEPDSPFAGKKIRDIRLRELTETMIIGIERGDKAIVNFNANFEFREGDVLLLAGEQEKLDMFGENIRDI